ncbi:MAG: HNH endonuclease [Planctomycetes bacterium]|nr:HNH endonuclease [Planctomycetota bacterium]
MVPLKAYVAVTDAKWFRFLSALQRPEEVNFWRPSTKRFRALAPGEPLLFKLHHPESFIVGGGFFAHSTTIPATLAWHAFGERNGAGSFDEMCAIIESYSSRISKDRRDYSIGCILLQRPFFFPRSDWLPVPADFASNIVSGKSYDLTRAPGRELWAQVASLLAASGSRSGEEVDPRTRGDPRVVIPRVGQGTFRLCITDAYERTCAMTGERALPVLEAAHILPVSEGGQHRMENGLLLRSDLHALFDHGYITVTRDFRIRVSSRLKTDFDDGEPYYPLHDQKIKIPKTPEWRPSEVLLAWHAKERFRSA